MQLIKYALLTFLIGIIALFVLSSAIEPKPVSISGINGKMIDNYVKVSGTVSKLKSYGRFTVFQLKDSTGSMPVIIYEEINATGRIEITGKIKPYRGNLEIEADKIEELNS